MHQHHQGITGESTVAADEPQAPVRYYAFGPYVLDTVRRVLWRERTRVNLTRTPFDVLVTLIQRRAGVVSKDELIEAIWGGRIVEENSLARHVSTLRKALNDTREVGEYITTVHALGYRFTAAVVELDALPDGVGQPEAVPTIDEAVRTVGQLGRVVVESASQPSEAGRPVTPVRIEPVAPARQADRWWVTAVTTAAVVLVAITGMLALIEGRGAPPVPAGTVEPYTSGGLDRQPTWSPDGRAIAFVSDREGSADIWIRPADSPAPYRVTTSPAQDWQPAWAPDGRWLAFRSERGRGGIYLVSPSGHSERELAPFGYRPIWSPDGRQVLFFEHDPEVPGAPLGLYLVDVAGGPVRRVLDELTAGFVSGYASWRPTGGQLAIWGQGHDGRWKFLTASPETEAAEEWTLLPEARHLLDSGLLRLERFAWTRSERVLYFEGRSRGVRNIWRVPVDPVARSWRGVPERLTIGAGQDTDIALAPDDARLAFGVRAQRTGIWAFDLDVQRGRLGDEGVQLTPRDADARTFDVAPEGRRLIYRTVRGEWDEIWTRSFDGGGERLLLASAQWRHVRPLLSRDGTRLAYVRTAPAEALRGDGALVVVDVDEGTERIVAMPDDRRFVPDDWTGDGRSLMGTCRPDGSERRAVCVVDVDTGDVQVVLADDRRDLRPRRLSPDGRWLAFTASHPGSFDTTTLYVAPLGGGSWVRVTDGRSRVGRVVWSEDGRALYYVSDPGGGVNVWRRRFEPATGRTSGEPYRLTAFEGAQRPVPDDLDAVDIAVADGRLVLPVTETSSRIWTVTLDW